MEVSNINQKNNPVSIKQQKSLLFIDDNPLILETVKQLLETSTYELLLNDDPFEGLCTLIKSKPAIVFIDVNLGKVNGYQFCALVKAQAAFRYIPLIVVLEFANKLEEAKAYAAGANAVLVKPFGKNELLDLCSNSGVKAA